MQFDIVPGKSIGPFTLGSSLYHILNYLRLERSSYPHIKLIWDADNLVVTPIFIEIQSPGMIFMILNERLQRIVVLDAQLTYNGERLAWKGDGVSDVVTLARRQFGPTYDLKATNDSAHQLLQYPGLNMYIKNNNNVENQGKESLVISRVEVVSDGELKDVVQASSCRDTCDQLFDSVVLNHLQMAPPMKMALPIEEGLKYCVIHMNPLSKLFEKLDVHVRSASCKYDDSDNDRGVDMLTSIYIGSTTTEDLMMDLGSAARVYYKEDNRMNIHQGKTHTLQMQTENNYFLSYFDLGMTFMMDGFSHRLLKIILHSSLPGCSSFGRFERCVWKVQMGSDSVTSFDTFSRVASFISDNRNHPEKYELGVNNNINTKCNENIGSSKKSKRYQTAVDLERDKIESAWNNETENLTTRKSKSNNMEHGNTTEADKSGSKGEPSSASGYKHEPLSLDRNVDDAGSTVTVTKLYGFPSLIFEVVDEKFIETVWIV